MTPKRVALLFAFIGLLILAGATQDSGSSSSYSAAPKGSKALFEILEDSGLEVARWRSPLSELADASGEGMVIIEPRPDAEIVYSEIFPWVKQGNTLFVIGQQAARQVLNSPELGVRVDAGVIEMVEGALIGSEAAAVATCHGLLKTACPDSSSISRDSFGRVLELGRAEKLIESGSDTVAVRVPLEGGQVVAVFGTRLVANEFIDKHQNFEVIFPLLTSVSRLWFDEFHHGYRPEVPVDRKSFFVAVVLFSSILFVCLTAAVFSRAIRFVPAQIPAEPSAAVTDLTTAVSMILYEAREPRALALYSASWKDRIGREFGLSSRYTTTAFCESLRRAHVSEWQQIKQSLETLEKASLHRELELRQAIKTLEQFSNRSTEQFQRDAFVHTS